MDATFQDFAKLGAQYGIAIVAYEGGQSLTGTTNQQSSTSPSTTCACTRPTSAYLSFWKQDFGSSLFMHFGLAGEPGLPETIYQYGFWGSIPASAKTPPRADEPAHADRYRGRRLGRSSFPEIPRTRGAGALSHASSRSDSDVRAEHALSAAWPSGRGADGILPAIAMVRAHVYPPDLARYVEDHWPAGRPLSGTARSPLRSALGRLPGLAHVRGGAPHSFSAAPHALDEAAGAGAPNEGVLRLRFDPTLPLPRRDPPAESVGAVRVLADWGAAVRGASCASGASRTPDPPGWRRPGAGAARSRTGRTTPSCTRPARARWRCAAPGRWSAGWNGRDGRRDDGCLRVRLAARTLRERAGGGAGEHAALQAAHLADAGRRPRSWDASASRCCAAPSSWSAAPGTAGCSSWPTHRRAASGSPGCASSTASTATSLRIATGRSSSQHTRATGAGRHIERLRRTGPTSRRTPAPLSSGWSKRFSRGAALIATWPRSTARWSWTSASALLGFGAEVSAELPSPPADLARWRHRRARARAVRGRERRHSPPRRLSLRPRSPGGPRDRGLARRRGHLRDQSSRQGRLLGAVGQPLKLGRPPRV